MEKTKPVPIHADVFWASLDTPNKLSNKYQVDLSNLSKEAVRELEAMGVAKDLNGIPVLTLPPQVLASDASAENQAQRQYFENAMRNLQVGEQMAVILPAVFDEQGKPMYSLQLLSSDGKKNFDLNKIKDYYKNLIFTSLFSDVLQMGQSATGSFALGAIKNSLSGAYAERLIANIAEVIQNDLIRQTYELNNWSTERMGTLDYDGIEPADLETFSKAVQRMGATGYLPKTLDVINTVLINLGIDPLPEDADLDELLPESTTRSGDGLSSETGGLNGTANSAATNDTSSMTSENAA